MSQNNINIHRQTFLAIIISSIQTRKTQYFNQKDTYLLRTDGKNYVNRNNKEGLGNISCKGSVYLKLLMPKQSHWPPSQ